MKNGKLDGGGSRSPITTKVSDVQRARYLKAARAAQATLSAWMRRVMDRAAARAS